MSFSCLGPLVLLHPKTFEIIWLCNLSISSVPDKGYSRSASNTLTVISTLYYFHLNDNRDGIGGVIVSVLAFSVVDSAV